MPFSAELETYIRDWKRTGLNKMLQILSQNEEINFSKAIGLDDCPMLLITPTIPVYLNGHIYDLTGLWDESNQTMTITRDIFTRKNVSEADIQPPPYTQRNFFEDRIKELYQIEMDNKKLKEAQTQQTNQVRPGRPKSIRIRPGTLRREQIPHGLNPNIIFNAQRKAPDPTFSFYLMGLKIFLGSPNINVLERYRESLVQTTLNTSDQGKYLILDIAKTGRSNNLYNCPVIDNHFPAKNYNGARLGIFGDFQMNRFRTIEMITVLLQAPADCNTDTKYIEFIKGELKGELFGTINRYNERRRPVVAFLGCDTPHDKNVEENLHKAFDNKIHFRLIPNIEQSFNVTPVLNEVVTIYKAHFINLKTESENAEEFAQESHGYK